MTKTIAIMVSITEKWWWCEAIITGTWWCIGAISTTGWRDKRTPGVEWIVGLTIVVGTLWWITVVVVV